MLEDSILLSVAKFIGFEDDYSVFDKDLIKSINTELFNLYQLGVGPDKPFVINSSSETWSEFFGDKEEYFQPAKEYVYIRVKRVFDPPANSTLMDALTQEMREIEWRLTVMVDELSKED